MSDARDAEDLARVRWLLQIVTEDYGDQCDHPEDCACSMAQAIRYIKAAHGTSWQLRLDCARVSGVKVAMVARRMDGLLGGTE